MIEKPARDVTRLYLTQVIDEETLRLVLMGLSQELGAPTVIVEQKEGEWRYVRPHSTGAWCSFCKLLRNEFHCDAACIESDQSAANRVYSEGGIEPIEVPCHMGLTEIVMGIQVGGKVCAMFMSGQLRGQGQAAVRQIMDGIRKRQQPLNLTDDQVCRLDNEIASIREVDVQGIEKIKGKFKMLGGTIRKLAETKHRYDKARHELRGLGLMIVRGSADLISRHCRTKYQDERLRGLCDELDSGIAYLILKADQDAIVSQIEQKNGIRLSLQTVNVYDVLARIERLLKREAEMRDIVISVDSRIGHQPSVQMDPDAMFVALANVIQNAVKYSYRGRPGRPNPVTVSPIEGDAVCFKVSNLGMGIATEDEERIFAPYTQGKNFDHVRFIPGTGLGLHVAKEIVEAHGGSIKAWCDTFEERLSAEMLAEQRYITRPWRTSFTINLPVRRRT